MPNHRIICAKSEIELTKLKENSIDSCVTDPPYELSFMNRKWDGTGIAFNGGLWKEVFTVLKPGAHLLAFGGTRTYHRMVCAIEDAGFEIRDMIEWFYGSGFPKSLDISKAIDKTNGFHRGKAGVVLTNSNSMLGPNYERTDKREPISEGVMQWNGWGTGLKPNHEPIVLARKPLTERNVAANVLKWGVGAINIDGCRVTTNDSWGGESGAFGSVGQTVYGDGHQVKGEMHQQGRFPANLILECCCEDNELMERKVNSGGGTKTIAEGITSFNLPQRRFNYGDKKGIEKCQIHTNPNCMCRMLDEQSGKSESTDSLRHNNQSDISGKKGIYGKYNNIDTQGFTDRGGASRFFYQAKASQSERWFYCRVCKRSYQIKNRDKHIHNAPSETRYKHLEFHPTQKPIQLIQYLLKLITPPSGTTLDPFLGSGTTLIAAEQEGFNSIGIDSNQIYCDIAHQRIKEELKQTNLSGETSVILLK